ncbi:MAG TPA: hypothetical protein VL173_03380 [Vicinamibacterales bacterium]|nr:hypothetical protein [Vicinamibacterales bacterium]
MTVTRLFATALALSVCLGVAGARLGAAAQQPAGFPTDWNTFSADFTVRTQQMSSDEGARVFVNPGTRFHVERSLAASGGWKTVTTMLGVDPFIYDDHGKRVEADHNPVARIEDDGDGSPVRIIGKNGKPIPLFSPELQKQWIAKLKDFGIQPLSQLPATDQSLRGSIARPSGREWVAELVDSRTAAERHADTRRRFGDPHGQERGFDHYMSFAYGRRTDVLTEPATGLLASIDTYENNALVMHSTFTWVQGPGSTFIRKSTHTERSINPQMRVAVDVALSNVTLERRTR